MSWGSYCDNLLASKLCFSAVVGTNGAIWAQKPQCISEAEAVTISKGLAAKDATQFQQNGLVLGGVKYMLIKRDDTDGHVQAKKGKKGITIYPANTCFVVGMYDEEITPPDGCNAQECSKAVFTIGTYLKENNC